MGLGGTFAYEKKDEEYTIQILVGDQSRTYYLTSYYRTRSVITGIDRGGRKTDIILGTATIIAQPTREHADSDPNPS